MALRRPKAARAEPRRTQAAHPPDIRRPPAAQMALFSFADGATLAIHIPRATGIVGEDSRATTPGYILRRGGEIVKVGVLTQLLDE